MPIQILRSKKNSILTTVLFSLIIISFVIWGVNDWTQAPSTTALTTVNGEEIPYADFQRVLALQMQAYGQAFGGGKQISDSLQQLIERQVANGLVMQTVLAQKASDMGIVIGEDEILKTLQENKAFHDPEKRRFSPSIYKNVLEMNGLRPSQYEASLKKQLLSQRAQDVLENSVVVSDAETLDAFRLQSRNLTLESAVFDSDRILKSGRVSVSEADMKNYYEQHKGEFLSPLQKRAAVAYITSDALAQKITPSEADVKNLYETLQKDSAQKDMLSSKQAHAYHLLISDGSAQGLQKAQQLKARIQSQAAKSNLKSAFMEMARAESEDYSNAPRGGDLGYFGEKTMVKPFATAVFAAKANTLVGPVKTDFGYHLIFVEDVTTDANTLNNRQKQMAYQVRLAQAQGALEELESKVKTLVDRNNTSTIENELKALGFEIMQTRPLHAQSREGSVPYLVLQEILQSPVQTWKGPKNIQGSLYAFSVTEEIKPQPLTFEESKEQIRKRLQSERVENLVRAEAEAVKAGKSTWPMLTKAGAELKQQKDFRPLEATQVPGLGESESLLRAAQSLTPESPVSNLIVHEGKWVLLRGTQFTSTDKPTAEQLDKTRQELLSKKRAMVMNDFVEKAVKSAKIPESFRKKYNF